MEDKGQQKDKTGIKIPDTTANLDSFVLDKGIFSNIFEKDIRRVYIYKKAERLAKAIHLVAPAFVQSPALRDRVDMIAVGLVDAAVLPPLGAREALSRELLALSSVLAIARVGGLLSSMNADLIAKEAQQLLHEIAVYEEPRLFLDEVPSLAELYKMVRTTGGKQSESEGTPRSETPHKKIERNATTSIKDTKGQVKDTANTSRREAIISVLRSKGPSYIKDISTVITDVSEKTIQRELQALVASGTVTRSGERRWTTYRLIS